MYQFKYDKHNKYHRAVQQTAIVIVSLVIFVEAWWVLSILANTPAVPTPGETWDALVNLVNNGDTVTDISLWSYIGASLGTFLKGFLLALLVAVPLGLILGTFNTLNEFATPIIEILRPIAPIAWAPILILAINYTIGPILVVFIGIFFPLLTNVVFGVSKIDSSLLDAAKTLGASRAQIFVKVMVPSTVPYIMNGVKVGLGIGWMCIVAAELYAPTLAGIGYFLSEQATLGYWPGAFAAIIVIAVLGLLTTGVAEYVHKFIAKRMGMDV
ncbi:MAG: ABC transporter permease [Candidatus Methanomethylophilus sp.]|nr:ABC transporter permease [Methanomethylophilus sp.]MDD3233503.1 ABC transporter permease [Methanomethylophilus sp.]MDD4221840.1 ABC transporter permease [Methanomethylophilus sp.]MDD4668306.1 ABC transporter permease [Methanomethylophilus sp.]